MRTRNLIFLAASLIALNGRAQVAHDEQWPLAFDAEGYTVRVYTPQPESIDGDRFVARSAVSLRQGTDGTPVFGAVWGEGLLAVDRTTRLGTLVRFAVSEVRFPDPIGQDSVRIRAMLSREIPAHTKPLPIDWLVAALESEQGLGTEFANDAPEIIYTERPSMLVFIDGGPEYSTLERRTDELADPVYAGISTDIERVENTANLLVRYQKAAHYLYGSGKWFRSTDILGPYVLTDDVPNSLDELAKEVDEDAATNRTTTVPEIVVREQPAQLLDLDGPPRMEPIQHTGLLYATNTDQDLFLEIATQNYYLLSAGRWYSTRTPRTGPWRSVNAAALPADFAAIPEGSPKDGVLAHVPGTAAAREAVRDSRIPQTATVDRHTASLSVEFDGAPRFEPIEGTDVFVAVNASTTVLRIRDHYHACDNAVWYDSPTSTGPWTVSTEVPTEVNSIPPSDPAYNVRYVYVYDHTPDVVFVGYTPGYLGCYVQNGVVIMGTGYYYPCRPGLWYPRPFTWGYDMYYDPWAGWTFGWGWGWNWFYPHWIYGGWPGPHHHWHQGGPWGWWGPSHHCPPRPQEPRPSYYGHRPSITSQRPVTNGQDDLYRSNQRPGVSGTAVDRHPPRTIGPAPVDPGKGTRSKPPANEPVRPSKDKDHFTDKDGHVFRSDKKGLERYLDGTWERMKTGKPKKEPAPRTGPFDIQQRRDRGDQRVKDLQHYQQRPPQSPPAPAPAPRKPGKR